MASTTTTTTGSTIEITLVYNRTGVSDTIPVDSQTTTIQDIIEWSKALFGIEEDANTKNKIINVLLDGRSMSSSLVLTLQQLNIKNGDLLVISDEGDQQQSQQQQAAATRARTTTSAPAPVPEAPAGGLDFSNLLQAATTVPTNTFSSNTTVPNFVYYNGMNLDEAIQQNPHPKQFITLLLSNDTSKQHLLKELNYHNPKLASKFTIGMDLDIATTIWRNELVKGSITGAMKATTSHRTENIMNDRLQKNPADIEAIEYFQKQQSSKLIQEQYYEMMEQYPEGLGRVLMLYIPVTINNTPIQAFCDSGAQATIMSKTIARQCQIDHLIDTRFAGIAVGVGTGTILGRIHIVQLSFNNNQLIVPCSVTVMDDPPIGSQTKSMPFLLGLDMMKRHLCQLDFCNGCIRFYPHGRSSTSITSSDTTGNATSTTTTTTTIVEVPFLHEKDLSFEQGGTKDFDLQKANEQFLKQKDNEEEEEDDDDNINNDISDKMDTDK